MESNESLGLNIEYIKVHFFKDLHYWYVLMIALIIGDAYGFYKVRYYLSTYSVTGRVLVKEEWKDYDDCAEETKTKRSYTN